MSGPGPAPSAEPGAALELSHLSVTFGAMKALDDVNLTVRSGSIHALLGGNGSGKSTLIKVLAGVQSADPGGWIRLGGEFFGLDELTPESARLAGLRFVHQDLGVFEDMTVAENFALYATYPEAGGGRIAWHRLNSYVAELLGRFEIEATPRTKISELRPAARTLFAVARALHDAEGGDRVLVLDEPTASLPAHEVDFLLDSLRRCAARGQTVVFVSHRLGEVLSLSDDLTVLRDGRRVATCDVASTTEQQVVELIAGRSLDRLYPLLPPVEARNAVAAVDNLTAGPLRGVGLTVQPGEVVGIAGLLGSGRTSLLRALFGDLAAAEGTVRVGSHIGPFRGPREAMKAGVAYVPEDRRTDAAFLDQSVRENLSIVVAGRYFRSLRIHRAAERRDAAKLAAEFMVKTASLTSPLESLSGGNQQKVILARWMQRRPTLLLLDEPTQGVDVVARADIYLLIRATAERGAGVIVVSSDFEELAHICDRVLILTDGRLGHEVRGATLNPESLYQLTQSLAETEVA